MFNLDSSKKRQKKNNKKNSPALQTSGLRLPSPPASLLPLPVWGMQEVSSQ